MKHRICPICDAKVRFGIMNHHCKKHHGINRVINFTNGNYLPCSCGYKIDISGQASGDACIAAMLEHWRQGGESHYMQVLLMQE